MASSKNDGDLIDTRRTRTPWLRYVLIALVVLVLLSASALISMYVNALWFGSLGYSQLFWKTLAVKAGLFAGFLVVTTLLLGGIFTALRPRRTDRTVYDRTIIVNGRPVTVSFRPVARLVTWAVALLFGVASAIGMAAEWTTFVLYWQGSSQSGPVDPVFGRSVAFYLLTLPAWQVLATWLTTMALAAVVASIIYFVIVGGERAFNSMRGLAPSGDRYGGISFTVGALLVVLAWRAYLGRFDRLFDAGPTFFGAGYTDVHIVLPGMIWLIAALLLGAVMAFVNAVRPRRLLWLVGAVVPAIVVYAGVGVISWYVGSFIVKPNELDRERPYISRNIEFTRQAFGLTDIDRRAFPADVGLEALDLQHNQATIDNVRLWDWRALQDTLRQVQAIRTYYDFPDVDIDRYWFGGEERQMMVAARELNLQRLPENSRNWINEKLIYTHGYGVTMNTVNGFTSEGLPRFVLSNMPVESTSPDIRVTRPEIYFGQETTSDVYVKTRQREFNYPEGERNQYTSYNGKGGIQIGSTWNRLLIAIDRGDLSKLPFSDDITPDSRLLMRREVRDRVSTIAPFLSYDPDPYIVVGDDGHLYWMIDAFTSSDTYPYATRYQIGSTAINYLRNSVKVVIDAYDGTTDFYVFDATDPIIRAYKAMFPALFRDASEMPAGVRRHVRYPEVLLKAQSAVYALYHMTDPEVFFNREDLWSVATQVTTSETRNEQQPMEPNFVLMSLPGVSNVEFVEILPFTPSKRNNMIGWIAGRSDGAAYGKSVAFDFPKTRMVDGPVQVQARIDQNPQLSAQFSLWNQQGSRIRRGNLLVIPINQGILYAEPIYLQAEHSPMPEMRVVVLATQDRLGHGSSFDTALKNLMSESAISSRQAQAEEENPLAGGIPGMTPLPPPAPPPEPVPTTVQGLIGQAAKNLEDYQRLTAEGKLAEAGQKLEALKQTLDQLRSTQQQPPPKK
jgi:uncharacterized membrane protein (UPF0182 family)